MHGILPPICLLLALGLLIAGFAMLAVEAPQPGIALHRARVENDEAYRDLLEAKLQRERVTRKVLIASLFGMAVLMGATGFAVMKQPPAT